MPIISRKRNSKKGKSGVRLVPL